MRRKSLVVLVLIFVLIVGGCTGGNDSKNNEPVENKQTEVVKPKIEKEEIKFGAKVLQIIDGGMRVDASKYFEDELYDNVVVVWPNSKDLKTDDYIMITGYEDGLFTYQSTFGVEITTYKFLAVTVELSSYQDVVSPALKTVEVNQSINQNDYIVTISKVEFAKNETRVYVKVENNGSDEFSIYRHSTALIQSSQQFEPTYNYDSDYPEVQRDLKPGVISEGILTFDVIEQVSFQLILEGRSGDYSQDFEDFVFDITVQ